MVFVNRTGPCNCLALSPGEWSLAARQKLQNNDDDGDNDGDEDDDDVMIHGEDVKKTIAGKPTKCLHKRWLLQVIFKTQNTLNLPKTNKQTKFSAGIGSMNIWLSKKKPPKMLIFSFS